MRCVAAVRMNHAAEDDTQREKCVVITRVGITEDDTHKEPEENKGSYSNPTRNNQTTWKRGAIAPTGNRGANAPSVPSPSFLF